MSVELRERIEAEFESLAAIRHDLHQHPELMFEEHRTSGIVAAELTRLGIEIRTGLGGGTGLVGWLPATQPGGGTVALRADMDALPIVEETGVPYASLTEGKMHACGHDGHTTILMGVARALTAESVRPNNVLFVFQPAEEGGGGADVMCREGILDGLLGKKPDVMYGLHGWPARAQGALSTRIGPLMASTDQFYVTITGKGAHAAAPDEGIDPIVAAASCITMLQTLVSRNISPAQNAVLTVGTVNGGSATNIIPEKAEFSGTIRTVDAEVRRTMRTRFIQLVESVCAGFGAQVDVRWEEGYPVTYNDKWATERFIQVAGEGMVSLEAHPKMGAEDFSYYGAYVPACFFFVGLRRPGQENPPGLHNPKFDFNDDVIPGCVEMMCRLALAPI